MKKRVLSLLLTMGLAASMLAGCGGGSNDSTQTGGSGSKGGSSDIEVGIVLPTKDEPRWLQDQAQFEKLLGDAGFTSQVLFSQGSSATEKTNVETLISKGIDVLVICPQDATAAAAAVEEAKKAGVTVISYDRLITDTDAVDYYTTFDSFSVGVAQGQYLIDNAQGSNIPLYIYTGASTDNNAFIFFEGAWSVLEPKVEDGTFVIANSDKAEGFVGQGDLSRDDEASILGQTTTNWDFDTAKKLAEANLTSASADLKGDVSILAPNDGTARAIADAFAADSSISSYTITGQDSEMASVQYVIDGKQSMTVFKDTRTLAADSVAMALAVLKGEEVETTTTYNNGKIDVPAKQTDIVVVTKDNVKSALIDSGYYDASDFTGLD